MHVFKYTNPSCTILTNGYMNVTQTSVITQDISLSLAGSPAPLTSSLATTILIVLSLRLVPVLELYTILCSASSLYNACEIHPCCWINLFLIIAITITYVYLFSC